MPDSSLDPDNLTRGRDRRLGRGHGTAALGPSDSSDSGSDLQGAPGLAEDSGLDLDTGTTSDPERSTAHYTAGPDVGDANLDSDTDANGTGERATAGRDTVVRDGSDIDTDHIYEFPSDMEEEEEPDRPAGSTKPGRGRKPAR